ncbi:hypothetical protein SUGI_0542620 [Cryptomeria japonica]|nr:hypothetical protein SUGI_0542620 [Cryptomeria japonica]
MSGLAEGEALQLFCWHAFSRVFAEIPYKKLSTRIARACRGHPLALQVIGAHLFDKKERDDIQCWKEALHNIGENQEISLVAFLVKRKMTLLSSGKFYTQTEFKQPSRTFR